MAYHPARAMSGWSGPRGRRRGRPAGAGAVAALLCAALCLGRATAAGTEPGEPSLARLPLSGVAPQDAAACAGWFLSEAGHAEVEPGDEVLAVMDLPGPRGRVRDALAVLARGGAVILLEFRAVPRGGAEAAAWGGDGQLLLGARGEAPAREALAVEPGGGGTVPVGREVPFAGWLVAFGKRQGWVGRETEWRDLASSLEVSAALAPGGAVRVACTPALEYLQGRSPRRAVYDGLRWELTVPAGGEARLTALGPQGEHPFLARFLAGYDPQRRVRPVDLVVRARVVGPRAPSDAR